MRHPWEESRLDGTARVKSGRWVVRVFAGGAVLLWLFASLSGCERSSWSRIPLQGQVLLDGQPAPEAALTLLPAEGNRGPAVTTAIREGRYEFTRQTGPVAGPHEARLLLPPEKMPEGGAAREDAVPSTKIVVPHERPYSLEVSFELP